MSKKKSYKERVKEKKITTLKYTYSKRKSIFPKIVKS